jgi:hypothetical protein
VMDARLRFSMHTWVRCTRSLVFSGRAEMTPADDVDCYPLGWARQLRPVVTYVRATQPNPTRSPITGLPPPDDFQIESQINGNNGEWTNSDDMPTVKGNMIQEVRAHAARKKAAAGGGGKSKVRRDPRPPDSPGPDSESSDSTHRVAPDMCVIRPGEHFAWVHRKYFRYDQAK